MSITRKVSLKCSVCGNGNFEFDDALYNSIEEAEQLKCTVCNKVYTQEELREVNTSLINSKTEELVDEILVKELKKAGFNIKRK